jgi:hypothetical protein
MNECEGSQRERGLGPSEGGLPGPRNEGWADRGAGMNATPRNRSASLHDSAGVPA